MDDYIKRLDAIKTVCGDCEYYSTNDCEDCRLDRLTKIPPADVRPVKEGKWLEETDFVFSDLAQRVSCSECGMYAYFYDKLPSYFCPNCGAKMGGEPNG